MGKYISGSELIADYELKPFELYDLVERGLVPYRDNGLPIKVLNLPQHYFMQCRKSLYNRLHPEPENLAEKVVHLCQLEGILLTVSEYQSALTELADKELNAPHQLGVETLFLAEARHILKYMDKNGVDLPKFEQGNDEYDYFVLDRSQEIMEKIIKSSFLRSQFETIYNPHPTG